MSRLVFNRNGGSADEYGHLLAFNRLLTGDIIEGMAVTAQTSPNMTVLVGPGTARISTGTYPSSYGYLCAIDTSGGESVTITTADATNPRLDLIVAYVDVSVTPSTSSANNPGMLKVAAVAGTPNASPVAPNSTAIQSAIGASNPYAVVGKISVAANVTQITNANITDMRTMVSTIKRSTDANGWTVYDAGSSKQYRQRLTISATKLAGEKFTLISAQSLPVGMATLGSNFINCTVTLQDHGYSLNVGIEASSSSTSFNISGINLDSATRTYVGWIDLIIATP